MNKTLRTAAASVFVGISWSVAAHALYVSRVSGRSSSGFATRVAPGNFQRASFPSGRGVRAIGASMSVPRFTGRSGYSMPSTFNVGGVRAPRVGGVPSFVRPGFGRFSSLQGPKFLRPSGGLTPVPTTRAPMPMGGMGIVFPQGYAFGPPKLPTIGAPPPSIEAETLRRQYPGEAPVLGPHDVIVPQGAAGQDSNSANATVSIPGPGFPEMGQRRDDGRHLGEGQLDQNPGAEKGPDAGDR